MHRFYLPPQRCAGNTLQLEEREAHHALHVLRLKPGEPAIVLDGVGREFLCEVRNVARDSLSLTVNETKISPSPACAITLLVGVPKGKIIESIIQKSVELGAHRIVPLLTERVVTQLDSEDAESKRDKWQQVAIEAIKQCGAVCLPTVETPMTPAQAIARTGIFDLSFVGSLQTERRHPRDYLNEFQTKHSHLARNVGVWIGPEGDFTPKEMETIRAAGALPITLGDLTLRVETAAIYCLSFLNYELNSTMVER